MDVEEDEKINSQKYTICCDVCKNIINLDDFYRRANPFKKMDRLTENLTEHKIEINENIKKIKQIKCKPLRRKNIENIILIDKWNKNGEEQ